MIDLCQLKELEGKDFCIVGSGGFVRKLLRRYPVGNAPQVCYLNDNPPSGIPSKPLTVQSSYQHYVLGSDVYQIEIAEKITAIVGRDVSMWDVSASMASMALYREPVTSAQHWLLFSVDAHLHSTWLSHFRQLLRDFGIQLLFRHPLQQLSDEEISAAQNILFWNGSTRCFAPLKQQLRRLKRLFTYVECGFFPQSEFFYLDKLGINAQSQLRSDDLDWLPSNYRDFLHDFSRQYFADVVAYPGNDFVFVPLQLESDSNVQNNSRFNRGMQGFIDYICQQYQDENLVFKAHPKDPKKHQYHLPSGKWANETSSLALIKSAKKVHGINSTVLFEAALLGVPTIAEGQCLLNYHCDNTDKLLAAMLLRQHPVAMTGLDLDVLSQFSHLDLSLFEA